MLSISTASIIVNLRKSFLIFWLLVKNLEPLFGGRNGVHSLSFQMNAPLTINLTSLLFNFNKKSGASAQFWTGEQCWSASLSIAVVNWIFLRRDECYSFTHILIQTLGEGSQKHGWYFFYLCFKVGGNGSPGKEPSLNPECNSFLRKHKLFRVIRLERSHFWALVRLSPLEKVCNNPLFHYKWTDSRMETEGPKSFPLYRLGPWPHEEHEHM